MNARKPEDGDPDSDDTFETWLKQVAQAPTAAATAAGVQLRHGETLCGGRLIIGRRLGEGGMGVVHEAFDDERSMPVALKTVSHLDAEDIYRFKNEFRSLEHVSHRNLCRFYELFHDQGKWFFTMELVAGEPFDRYVRPEGRLDETRLRSAMRQLCDAIGAIHGAGQLHRDLKPSNVLVTDEGRVVVLDFGLVTGAALGGVGETISGTRLSGTPSYMAPEQVLVGPATPASDLYALGVMLFEALTGRLPFEGALGLVLAHKVERDAPSVAELSVDAPGDLSVLCDELLSRQQDKRPSLATILQRLGPDTARDPERTTSFSGTHSGISTPPQSALQLVGRERELATLRTTYQAALGGSAVVLFVSGESGMGKSALVTAFLEERQRDAVVLTGRCNEREEVPFKAFDALVDNLSRHLHRVSREEALGLLPRDVFALARLFPTLERVAVVGEAPSRQVTDAPELRRRAFAAFGELIARIRDRQPLCLFIDDLQWVDADSVLLMRSLLVDRDPAPVMLIVSHRSEGAEQNQRLAAIREVADANAALVVRTLALGPLEDEATRELAQRDLPEDLPHRDALTERIVREAGGSPFLVTALAQHAARRAGSLQDLSLAQVLMSHLAMLDATARRLLEVSALAGQPLPINTVLAAADSNRVALDELRAQHLIRVSEIDQSRVLECYHDRIRETVAEGLSNEARAQHYRALANALFTDKDADPELLATCYEGSGRQSEAARFVSIAAERAERGMAFDRAAELYKRALDLGAPDAPERKDYLVAMAEALGSAGRAKDAAEAYFTAASAASGNEAIELRRKAGVQLLTGGYPQEGETTIRQVCADVGIQVPVGQGKVMLDYILMQARLRLKRLPRPSAQPKELPPESQLLLDVGRAAVHFGVDDPILGLWGGTKYLLLASEYGDAAHRAWALSFEGYNFTMLSPGSEKRIAQLFALAAEHAQVADEPEIYGVVKMHEAIGFAFGRVMSAETARRLLKDALELLQGRRGMRFQLDVVNLYLTRSPSTDLPREARRSALLVEEAFSLGRPWTGGHMGSMSAPVRLMTGDEAGVVRHLEQGRRAWQRRDAMQWMDATAHEAFVNLHHYLGEPHKAFELAMELWPLYERSTIKRSGTGAGLMHSFRGASAVWLALLEHESSPRRRELIATAQVDARQLAKGAFHPFPGIALAVRTGLALVRGDREAAANELRRYLESSNRSAQLAGTEVFAARRALGKLVGGDEGATMIADAEGALRQLGVLDVERSCQMLLPGCFVDGSPS